MYALLCVCCSLSVPQYITLLILQIIVIFQRKEVLWRCKAAVTSTFDRRCVGVELTHLSMVSAATGPQVGGLQGFLFGPGPSVTPLAPACFSIC